MTLAEYADYVRQNKPKRVHGVELEYQGHRLFSSMGIGEEAGEIVGLTKKAVFHEMGFQDSKILEESGDLLFYLVWYLSTFNLTLEDAFDANKAKLDKRYPDGWVPGGGIR